LLSFAFKLFPKGVVISKIPKINAIGTGNVYRYSGAVKYIRYRLNPDILKLSKIGAANEKDLIRTNIRTRHIDKVPYTMPYTKLISTSY
jgi:hypothetical protein